MRKEPYAVDSYVHIVKRGARGTPIVRDNMDRWRFLLMLRHLNDENRPEFWFRELADEGIANTLERPKIWPKQEKLVSILLFCLLDNHFHLLLKEIKDGGITTFMQKLGTSMAMSFNAKYKERGGLFQGAYRSRTISDNNYLRYVSVYIQVKNAFEMYPDGIGNATKQFEKAYAWASKYPYSSLGDYAGTRESPIIDKDILGEIFTPASYKTFSKEVMFGRAGIDLPGDDLE